ncbi:MAG: YidC/Oxa1 family insertase periplasmic-domain containing protein [Verrucomicrobia bacterium]|nr:YidC/Oxa1 family insertase periplasmic-domain containing protein [Verrucomicrobiota bacterium]MCH8527384.1 YidC/Oxa1 family insertase periplasmic-domain containing protein [Kiritimatiellia bacterium]
MNKKELATVVLLILLIPVVLEIDRRFIQPMIPQTAPAAAPEQMDEPSPGAPARRVAAEDDGDDEPAVEVVREADAVLEERSGEDAAIREEQFELRNEVLSLTFTNRGAAVLNASLLDFEATIDDRTRRRAGEDWNTVDFDFSDHPALSYSGRGIGRRNVFETEWIEEGRTLAFRRRLSEGVSFWRVVTLGDEYTLEVTDRWINESGETIQVPSVDLSLGPMFPLEDVSQRFGPFLGVDARHNQRGEGLKHYVKDITKWVKNAEGVHEEVIPLGMDWFTAKNKFFTQVLTLHPGDALGSEALIIRARAGTGDARIGMVQPSARMAAVGGIEGDGGVLERRYTYYAGPMKLENLRALGQGQEGMIDVRLWRIFVPLGRLMMNGLNGLHNMTRSWGLSIILLTVVVRMLFWPLTQKGAENMKKMSELSPQIKEIREKHKNNPQKMQQMTAALYKENRVNPMAGCLPMVVQIPVFFSLYGVLRVAVELRFAEFLWIRDLSEQEAIAFLFGYPLNILPLTMGATMVLQQQMTPSTMDPQQKKIMMMMPIVFLFVTYQMPSGLLLYWTTSNLISIYQSWHTRRKQAKTAASAPADAPKIAPTQTLQKRKPGSGKKKK